MNAILLINGFTIPEQRTDGSGLHNVYDALAEKYHDRRETWLGIRTWDAPTEHVADELVRLGVRKIVCAHYSWGTHGMEKFARRLKELGRTIDLCCAIDPVPYVWGRWASQALFPGDRLYKMPDNVRGFASWRTVNWPGFGTPWGRDVKCDGRDYGRTAFGSPAALTKYMPLGKQIIDADVIHGNIDEVPQVQDEIVRVIDRLFAEGGQ